LTISVVLDRSPGRLGRVVDATPGVANALGYDIEAALDDPVDH